MSGRGGPPRLLVVVLEWALPAEDQSVLGDLEELYAQRAGSAGRAAATWWYARQCAGFLVGSWSLRRHARRSYGGRRLQSRPLHVGSRPGLLDRSRIELLEALRPLRRRPGHAFAVVLTLAAGVAGVSAVYTLATWVALRPVPGVEEPERLATVLLHGNEREDAGWSMSHSDHRALRERMAPLAELAASAELDVHVDGLGDRPLRLPARLVTANYFEVLRARPLAGRLFDGSGDEAGTVVLSDALARRHFGTAAGAVGAALPINRAVYTVIGVAPRGFRGHELPGTDELWLPAAAAPALLHDPEALTGPVRQLWSTTIARVREGVALEALSIELTAALRMLQETGVTSFLGMVDLRLTAYPGVGLAPPARQAVRHTLGVLGAGAALLLLLACANVANLGLIRATTMRGELAMRRALGAGGGRIARARLLEGAALGLGGAVLGLGLAVFVLRALSFGGIAGAVDSLAGVRVEGRVIAFVAAVSVTAGCAAALLPALAASRVDAGGLLHAAERRHPRGRRAREGLVVAQVALSAVLVVSTGLLARTLVNLRAVDMGLDTTNVVSFTINASPQGYEASELQALLARLVETLEAEPGVETAGVIAAPPFAGFRMPALLRPPADPEGMVFARSLQVSPGSVEALGMSLLAGRPLSGPWLDSTTARTVLINEEAARALFPDADPADAVGRTVEMARGDPRSARIVGVLRDARIDHIGEDIEPLYVRPWGHGWANPGRVGVYIRARSDADALRLRIPAIVRAIDPGLPPHDVVTLEERVARLTVEQRFMASLGGVLAGVALFLTSLGLYAVLSQTVLERFHELGVRAALGAAPGTLLAAVAGRGFLLTLLGLVVGVMAAGAGTRLLEARLFEVDRLDPIAFAAGALVVLIVGMMAAVLPARRAARTDPATALRTR